MNTAGEYIRLGAAVLQFATALLGTLRMRQPPHQPPRAPEPPESPLPAGHHALGALGRADSE